MTQTEGSSSEIGCHKSRNEKLTKSNPHILGGVTGVRILAVAPQKTLHSWLTPRRETYCSLFFHVSFHELQLDLLKCQSLGTVETLWDNENYPNSQSLGVRQYSLFDRFVLEMLGGVMITFVPEGIDEVIQTFPPMTVFLPTTVFPPRMVAPE